MKIFFCKCRLLRSDILASAILCEVEPVTTEARNKFHKWMHEGARISPNLREVVYTAGITDYSTCYNRLFTKQYIRKVTLKIETLKLENIFQGIKYGGVKEWSYCWARYNSTRVPSERKLLLKVLGAASDPWILQRLAIKIIILVFQNEMRICNAGPRFRHDDHL